MALALAGLRAALAQTNDGPPNALMIAGFAPGEERHRRGSRPDAVIVAASRSIMAGSGTLPGSSWF
jgi:hypothetical protein